MTISENVSIKEVQHNRPLVKSSLTEVTLGQKVADLLKVKVTTYKESKVIVGLDKFFSSITHLSFASEASSQQYLRCFY